MGLLRRLVAPCALLLGCTGTIDVSVFEGQAPVTGGNQGESGSGGANDPPGGDSGDGGGATTGGRSSGGSSGSGGGSMSDGGGTSESGGASGSTGGLGGLGGEGGGEPFVPRLIQVDDFEDADTRAFDPFGWWYSVNDGSGSQFIRIVEGSAPDLSGTNVLQVEADVFGDWGFAWGVDVAHAPLRAGPLELSFWLAADREVEVTFHVIELTDERFTRSLQVGTQWSYHSLRLDQMVLVTEEDVRRLDPTHLDEIQWFVYDGQPVTLAMDEVILTN